jgi:hypothetical protein
MACYLFESRKYPLICAISPDPTGESLPAQWGPWDRTDAPWNGEHPGFLIGLRELMGDWLTDVREDDEPPATWH